MAVKRVVQDVLDRSPRLQALTPPKTREVVQWCRQRGYTPPDPEPQRRNDDESIEDILTQIDNEPGKWMCVWFHATPAGRFWIWLCLLCSFKVDQCVSLKCCMCGCSCSAVASWSHQCVCSAVVCEGMRCAASVSVSLLLIMSLSRKGEREAA